jgi:hypothetical protein
MPDPTIQSFQTFIQNIAGIGANYLPLNSPQIQYAFDQALNIVNPALRAAPSQTDGSWTVFELATYNLGVHLLIEFAQDVSWPIVSASWSAGYVTLALAPAASALTPGTGGTLPTGPVYVRVAYAYGAAYGAPSAEASAAVTGPVGALSVASPLAAPGATGYAVYAATGAGAETLQATAAIGTPVVLASLVAGAVPPAFLVAPGDRIAVAGVSPRPYDAGAFDPFYVYSVSQSAPSLTYPVAVNPGAGTVLPGAAVSETCFFQLRREYKIAAFAPGMVASASDTGTGIGLLNPQFMQRLQLGDIQLVKTPWGRAYLATAQKYGPNVWGLT